MSEKEGGEGRSGNDRRREANQWMVERGGGGKGMGWVPLEQGEGYRQGDLGAEFTSLLSFYSIILIIFLIRSSYSMFIYSLRVPASAGCEAGWNVG